MPSWKKVITSGSDAALNSINVTNGVTITGSLNVTGSTTQVGNNTLLGNTLLSGSITISGSTTPGSPAAAVQIYGDIRQSGYHRFDPVTTNIDTSVTASYIYVSGSTNDLYFSQNSAGYNNVTRLRWLEGNLYTGLLHGGLITTQSSTVYQISSGSGIIVDLNASLTDDPYPVVQFLQWGNLSASISAFTASYQQVFVGIDATGNIFAQGTPFSNGQFDSIINIGGVFFQNQSTINGVKTQPSVAYGFEQQQNTFNRAFGPLKLSGYTLAASASSTGSLIVASGTAYAPGSNYIVDPNEPYYAVDNGTNVSKIFRYRQSGSTWVYDTNAGAGYATIDPTQYSNNGVLTAVPGGGSNREWSIQRVFWFPNSVIKAIVVYYGNATYATELDAIANISFESFVEAPNTSANAIYLGAIVVRNNANFTVTNSYKIQPGGLFRQVGGSGGGGSVITQTLSGLSDVLISGPTDGQPLVYDHTAAKWKNSSTLTANLTGNASTATSASYATTASYVQTAQTASYVLQAVSASFATTALSSSYALSASYAPGGGNPFPFNGNAQISGSLGVTGSFSLQTFNGLTDVTAISFDGVTRLINDVMGSTSINADDRDLYDSANINSISWESRRLLDSAAVGSIRWDLRSTYDTVDSQSIAWGARLLKIDNGPGAYTVNWGSGILRDTNAKNSVDWQNRTTIDTNNKKSIDWENRKLLNTNETELLNWQNQITITGSATVSGSLELTGSFKMLGAYNGFAGPFKAIEIDDVNFIRQLFDVNAGVVSVDFGDRSLNTAAGGPAISWQGGNGTYQSNLYESQYIDSTTRNNVFGFNALAGQVLGESYFDINVMDNDLVYLETDGLWYQVNQTTDTSTKMLAIAKNVFSQTGSAFIEGDITVTTGAGYPLVAGANYGLPIYIKESNGIAMSTTIPTTGYVRLLGYCYHYIGGSSEWIMKFRPSNEWYVI